jgi:chemotaxis protein MotB
MALEEDPPAGVPEWVVTYGDMMSLLLTFFIMLVSLSEIKADGKFRAILEAIQHQLGYVSAPLAPPGQNLPLNAIVEKLVSLGSHSSSDLGRGGIKAQGPEGVSFCVTRRRDGIAIHVGGDLAFRPASADLSATARAALSKAALLLAGKPHKIDVRGHAAADPLPLDSPYADKFALSYERARTVLLALESAGIEHARLRASAAGDTQLPPERGDKQAWHPDRVEILVLDTFTSDFAGERDHPD